MFGPTEIRLLTADTIIGMPLTRHAARRVDPLPPSTGHSSLLPPPASDGGPSILLFLLGDHRMSLDAQHSVVRSLSVDLSSAAFVSAAFVREVGGDC